MGNKVNKGFFFYLMVLVGIALGVALIAVAIMILGGVSLFGISYFSHNTILNLGESENIYVINDSSYEVPADGVLPETTQKTTFINLFDNYTIKKIIIESELHNVNVQTLSSSDAIANPNIIFDISTNVKGFTKQDPKEHYKILAYYQSGVLNVKVIGLENLINFTNASNIVIKIPANKTSYFISKAIDFNVKSNSGNITIGNAKDDPTRQCSNAYFGALNLKTNTGNITINKLVELMPGSGSNKLSSSLETVSGKIEIKKHVAESLGEQEAQLKLFFGDLAIKTKNGNITVRRPLEAASKINVTCERSYMVFDDVECKTLEFTGESGKMTVGTVVGNVAIQEQTKLTVFEFDEVVGSFYVYGSKTSSVKIGKLNVTNPSDAANINTQDGDIQIDEVVGALIIETTTGSVNIGKCSATLNIESKSGAINVKMEGLTSDGEIVIYSEKSDVNLENVVSNLTLTSNGDINLTFKNSNNDNETIINTDKGKINIGLSSDYETILTVVGASNVEFDNVDREISEEEPYVIYVNNYSGDDRTMTINSQGKVSVDLVD